MVRVSSPAKLRPWSELTAKMVMGVVPGLVKCLVATLIPAFWMPKLQGPDFLCPTELDQLRFQLVAAPFKTPVDLASWDDHKLNGLPRGNDVV